ncbi:sigma 54-interacting transcriptional regulator, partial [Myxococcota bacterium]
MAEPPLDQQSRLLVVLDKRTIRRVGETQGRSIDFQLIAATSRDLRELVRKGLFREEFFFRLN